MLTKPIPATGEPLPAIGLGTYKAFDLAGTLAERARLVDVLKIMLAAGGTILDSSPMYGRAEARAGEAMAAAGARERCFTMTKVWTRGAAAGIAQMEESFRLLGVASIDLMQIHNLVDWKTHLATLRAWREQGRIRYIGLTHYTTGAFDELAEIVRRERVDFLQFPYSVAVREAERMLLPLAAERGIATISNRPFEGGTLLRQLARRPVPAWAAEFGAATWPAFLLKYILAEPALTCAIPATQNPDHARALFAAGAGRLPTAEERRRMIATIEAA